MLFIYNIVRFFYILFYLLQQFREKNQSFLEKESE